MVAFETPSVNAAGRSALRDWKNNESTNFFQDDMFLPLLLRSLWGDELLEKNLPRLRKAGESFASIDEAVQSADHRDNLPRLERFSSIGDRIEQVIFHPAYREVGRSIYGSGMMSVYEEPSQNLLALTLFYLSAQNGEAGHNCPVACTAGIVKVLQKVATGELAERYLPRLLDPNYDQCFTGAQFLTEIQGGSDVGANGTTATPHESREGLWWINGEKWFCSNVNAELILMTARVPDQGDGTKGLGLFLVPRNLEDGQLNGIYVRRLKEKLGTRAMASGECDFRQALAYQIGPTQEGFHNVMRHVINTSRLYNAMGVAGNARRAFGIAWNYAQHRQAFGQPIQRFPLVQDLLARMKTDIWAMMAGSAHLINLQDKAESGSLDQEETAFLRMGLNLNKFRSAVLAHEVILQSIELLGGNGAIESFSALPRLLRDNVVYENWEGTHNVLIAQVQRDISRFQVHTPFFAWIDKQWDRLPQEHPLRAAGHQATKELQTHIQQLLDLDPMESSLYFRPALERTTDLYYAAALCQPLIDAQERQDNNSALVDDAMQLFFARRIQRLDAFAIPQYNKLVQRLAGHL
ncbi:MAG: acyl-CoA dehydrogenase family protein [Myxococcales bacterium]|nr:acyl-CoA dehydrogenase family protein [Myxococcales bacterium]MCB9644186.1 acyl-CoA dehydrogenase family protein [Myxococcales bacterium]